MEHEACDKGYAMRGMWYEIWESEKGNGLRVMWYDSHTNFYRLGNARFEAR